MLSLTLLKRKIEFNIASILNKIKKKLITERI